MSWGRKSLATTGLVVLILFYQNCSSTGFSTTGSNSTTTQQTGDGQVFDGKLRILHHIVDGFTCEGRLAPESILARNSPTTWDLIQNTPDKCAASEKTVDAALVAYDETLKVAVYDGKTYVPPRPYDVLASEDPNTSDANLLDGVCANAVGRCSLRAAVEQSGPTSLTEAVIVRVPAGTYSLTDPLKLWILDSQSHAVTVRGAGAGSTILDGMGANPHFFVRAWTPEPIAIEGFTLKNGLDPVAQFGASIQISPYEFYLGPKDIIPSRVVISDCIFQDNKNAATIRVHQGSGVVEVRRSQIYGGTWHGLYLTDSYGFVMEDSIVAHNNARGIVVTTTVGKSVIRNSSFFDNYEGISLYDCHNCSMENVSSYQHVANGLWVSTSKYDPEFNFTIKQSTFYDNARTPSTSFGDNGNVSFGFASTSNFITATNSIFAFTPGSGLKNCVGNADPAKRVMIATNSLFDDVTCGASGSGNISGDPMLSVPANNGGFTPTLLPRAGSPVIDAGSNAVCTPRDQRGLPRLTTSGPAARCDIGSVELQ